jgi:hypothetical protein
VEWREEEGGQEKNSEGGMEGREGRGKGREGREGRRTYETVTVSLYPIEINFAEHHTSSSSRAITNLFKLISYGLVSKKNLPSMGSSPVDRSSSVSPEISVNFRFRAGGPGARGFFGRGVDLGLPRPEEEEGGAGVVEEEEEEEEEER